LTAARVQSDNQRCEILGSHSGVDEDPSLLGYDDVEIGYDASASAWTLFLQPPTTAAGFAESRCLPTISDGVQTSRLFSDNKKLLEMYVNRVILK
jgi:hypothetical protein